MVDANPHFEGFFMIDILKLKKDESLKDHCGIFGIFAPKEDVSRISFFGLYSLQHRGQESAGIVVSDGKKLKSVRGLGLVGSVFNEKNISSLKGFMAIGHTRYSTTGSNTINNVQPITLSIKNDPFALAHNGNIINSVQLQKELSDISLYSTTDSEIIGWFISQTKGTSWGKKIYNSINRFNGAFSIVAMTKTELFAFRDPFGFRPLVLGKLNGGYVVCSETCALDTIGANYIRDIKPGEIVKIDNTGLHEVGMVKGEKKSFCLFEYVYLARPDSVFKRELVHQVRQRSGEILSYESPVAGDLVVAVPDSGTSAAIGYSKASGIPFGEILIKNRYIGRTFIQPEQRIRDMGVRIKFNPLKKIVKGKRIIIVDDSIVRGTTIKKIIQLLKKFGTKKIHVRICSPPIPYACYFGIDTPDPKRLIASEKNVHEIKQYIGADSLAYLSLTGLIRAARQKKKSLCAACFNGKYPLPIDQSFNKTLFEKQPLRLAIFISGGGTTAENIIKAYRAGEIKNIKPILIISSKSDAKGIQKAKALGIINVFVVEPKKFSTPHEFGNELLALLRKYKINLISQNGWLPRTPVNVVKTYDGRIINQHPGPLDPGRKYDFGGKGMYGARVICARLIYSWLTGSDFWTEATTHFVTEQYDEGKLINTTKMNYMFTSYPKTKKELEEKKESIIEKTRHIQERLLPLEHKNVIETLKQFSNEGIKEKIRLEVLVPEKNNNTLEYAKQLAIQLFPHG